MSRDEVRTGKRGRSILPQLVRKDLAIMKRPALAYLVGGMACIAFAVATGDSPSFLAQILFITLLAGAGVHAAMRTVHEERREQNLVFILSLPITIVDYTKAKLAANFLIFGMLWLPLSAASYVIFLGSGWPDGAIPFFTIILVTILLVYVVILSTCLVFGTQAAAIAAIIGSSVGGQAFVWGISGLYGVRSTINGNEAVWNATYLGVLGLLVLAMGALLGGTLYVQSRKTEFVG